MPKNNNGILYKSTSKSSNLNAPDYSGIAVIDGKNKNMCAWIRIDKNGKEYLSMSFSDEVKITKEKVVPVKSKNKSGKRDLDKIGVGVIDTKKQIIDVTGENLPF